MVQRKDMVVSLTVQLISGHVQYPNDLEPPTKLNAKPSPVDDTLEGLLYVTLIYK